MTYEDSIRERIPAQDAGQTSCLDQYKPKGVGANWGRFIRIKEWTIEIVSLKLLARNRCPPIQSQKDATRWGGRRARGGRIGSGSAGGASGRCAAQHQAKLRVRGGARLLLILYMEIMSRERNERWMKSKTRSVKWALVTKVKTGAQIEGRLG